MSNPTAPAGLIHDIGYRHYDGPRLGRAYVLRSLYVANVRAVYGIGRGAKSKFFPILLSIFMLVPAAGSIAIVGITGQSRALIPYSSYPFALQVLVAIFLASQSPVIAARELRSHTLPLYFSRPVGVTDFVLAKLAAMVTAVFALISAPLLLLWIGALSTKVPHPMDQTWNFLGGLVGAVVYAIVLGTLGTVVAALAPRRGFGIAAIMVAYMLSNVIVGITQGVSSHNGNDSMANAAGLFTPFELVNIVQVTLLGGHVTFETDAGPLLGVVALAGCAVIAVGGLGILIARFRKAGQ